MSVRSSALKPTSRQQADKAEQSSLYQQIRFARVWLPLAIVGVVLGYQLLVVPLGGDLWRFWSQILFYSVVGPIVTFITLDWIGDEVRQRERAQDEQARLYGELRESHALLGSLQKITEEFASATDLEAALSAASQGITEVTAATGSAIFLHSSRGLGVTQSHGLDEAFLKDAHARSDTLQAGEDLASKTRVHRRQYWILSMSLTWAGRLEGSIHAYYPKSPSSEQRESFSILCSEFSAAAEATQSRTRDLLTLFEVDRSIRAEGNLERLLETLLTQMMERVNASMGGVYLADEESRLNLRTWDGLPHSASTLPIRFGEGFVGCVAQDGVAQVAGNLDEIACSGDSILQQANSAIGLPLLSEEGLLGVVVLAHEAVEHFDARNLPFLSLLASQVTLAVRNARAYLQSEELAIAEERARIAREIHDGVAQSLAFAALKLDVVSRLLDTNGAKAKTELDNTKNTIREMIREVRRSIFALRPIDLERHGFVETIRRYSSDYGQQNDIVVDLDIQDMPQLSAKSEAVLFRIFQEAMNNVIKHSCAKQVNITLGQNDAAQAFVRVEDDGCGFDLDTVSDRVTSIGGLGLKQMKERLEARGGYFQVNTHPSQGTQLYASLPA